MIWEERYPTVNQLNEAILHLHPSKRPYDHPVVFALQII